MLGDSFVCIRLSNFRLTFVHISPRCENKSCQICVQLLMFAYIPTRYLFLNYFPKKKPKEIVMLPTIKWHRLFIILPSSTTNDILFFLTLRISINYNLFLYQNQRRVFCFFIYLASILFCIVVCCSVLVMKMFFKHFY